MLISSLQMCVVGEARLVQRLKLNFGGVENWDLLWGSRKSTQHNKRK